MCIDINTRCGRLTKRRNWVTKDYFFLRGMTDVLKVFVKGERTGFLVGGLGHDTGLLVVGDSLFEEVGLTGQGNVFHEIEGVVDLVVLLVTEGDQESVCDELDVLVHQVGVHT